MASSVPHFAPRGGAMRPSAFGVGAGQLQNQPQPQQSQQPLLHHHQAQPQSQPQPQTSFGARIPAGLQAHAQHIPQETPDGYHDLTEDQRDEINEAVCFLTECSGSSYGPGAIARNTEQSTPTNMRPFFGDPTRSSCSLTPTKMAIWISTRSA